jgi:hypothetical protein
VASYSLIASESTVQVLSPTAINDVVYCTIQTAPSGVIASMPIPTQSFDAGGAPSLLHQYASGIETMLGLGYVTGGAGVQTIDPSGLLQDQVAFTVEYTPPTSATGTSITAEALVPSNLLYIGGGGEANLIAEAEAIITAVYDNLKLTAGG